MKTIWVLTMEVNEYDQHGAYFIAWYPKYPTIQQLGLVLNINDIELFKHIRAGGGRIGTEDVWYHLCEEEPFTNCL